jgi:hypothetical protein
MRIISDPEDIKKVFSTCCQILEFNKFTYLASSFTEIDIRQDQIQSRGWIVVPVEDYLRGFFPESLDWYAGDFWEYNWASLLKKLSSSTHLLKSKRCFAIPFAQTFNQILNEKTPVFEILLDQEFAIEFNQNRAYYSWINYCFFSETLDFFILIPETEQPYGLIAGSVEFVSFLFELEIDLIYQKIESYLDGLKSFRSQSSLIYKENELREIDSSSPLRIAYERGELTFIQRIERVVSKYKRIGSK